MARKESVPVKFSASLDFDLSGAVAPGAAAMVVAFVTVEVPVTVISPDSTTPGVTVNAGVADEAMSLDNVRVNAVVSAGPKFVLEVAVDAVFAGLKFVLGAFGVVSLDNGEPPEVSVDTVVGLVTGVTSPGVDE